MNNLLRMSLVVVLLLIIATPTMAKQYKPYSRPVQPPPPSIYPPTSKYVMINSVNWQSLASLPLADGSEFTYFVVTSDSSGRLSPTASGGSAAQETAFVAYVHSAGKKATFTIGGAAQSAVAIATAVNNQTGLVSGIVNHMNAFGYDGVVIDIEDSNIASQKMTDFIIALRTAIGPDKILGIDVQPYQINTVWATIGQAQGAITYLAPMLYDFGPFSLTAWINDTNVWLTKVPANKLMSGLAVNYPNGGLTASQYAQMLDAASTTNWKGIAIWENTLYTQQWLDVARAKLIVQ